MERQGEDDSDGGDQAPNPGLPAAAGMERGGEAHDPDKDGGRDGLAVDPYRDEREDGTPDHKRQQCRGPGTAGRGRICRQQTSAPIAAASATGPQIAMAAANADSTARPSAPARRSRC